jgi:hypothetical protein
MRVRCDKCGTKALVAASQCPSCGHLLQVRDGFGDLLPLTQCPTCESHYPLRDGECRWCGTKPEEGRRMAPYVWKGVGVVACLGVAWGTWLISRSGNETVATSQLVNQPTGLRTTVVDSGEASLPAAQLTSADTTTPQVATNGSASDGMYAQSASQDTTQAAPAPVEAAPAPESFTGTTAAEVTPVREPPVREPTIVAKRSRTPSKAAAATAPRRSARWSGAAAREWVTVRAAPAHSARFVASIGPDTRVQLGEARGDWRRIRMKGISGWVERAQF